MSLLDRVEGKDYDDRSTAEQLRDLGLEVIITNRPKITDVRWARRHVTSAASGRQRQKREPTRPFARLSGYGLLFNILATRLLDPAGKRYSIGAADFGRQGETAVKVLLLREGGSYRISQRKDGYSTNRAPGLIRQLQTAGLSHGRYELVQVNDGWMGVPME